MDLKIPSEDLILPFTAALKDVIQEADVVNTIKQAAQDALALRAELDKEQVARHFGIEERALERWMKPKSEGGLGLPYRKYGNAVRFKLASIEAWSDEHEVNRVLPKVA